MKKGFTLIELLAVIVVLAIISVIAVPRIMDAITTARDESLKQSKEFLVRATQNYLVERSKQLPKSEGDTIEVSIEELINKNKLTGFNYDGNSCTGYVLITKISSNYEYIPKVNCYEDIKTSSEDGLIAYYKLSNNAIDYSLSSNDGLVVNAVSAEDRFGNIGGALSFNGTNSYVSIPNIVRDNLHGEEEATISMWIKLNSSAPGTSRSGVVQLSGHESTNGNLYPYTGNRIYLDLFRTNRLGPILYPDIDLTEWNNMVVTTSPGSNGWRLYINGQLLHSTTGQNSVSTDYLDFRIGNNSNSRWLDGFISDVSIYNRSLSPEEIRFLYKINNYFKSAYEEMF